jgi:two-component system response regulator LytT
MDCIIIEDENKAAKNLQNLLQSLDTSINVLAVLDSVEESVHWLQHNKTDLIFMDIQLGDGIAFEIFDHVQIITPIIFITSYDQYWAKAFEVNSISYILKPVMRESLVAAIAKYSFLYEKDLNQNEKMITLNQDYQQRFMVKKGNSALPVIPIENVAWFYVHNKHFLFLFTKDKQQYLYDSTLEILEQRLDPKKFFRINRHCIMAAESIKQVSNTADNSRRILITTDPESKDEMIVSRNRVADFKLWLNI